MTTKQAGSSLNIDLARETLLTFSQAAKRLPSLRNGKHPHVQTLHRWATRGCRGVVLPSVSIGGTRCTSVEALQAFIEEVTRIAGGETGVGVVADAAAAVREPGSFRPGLATKETLMRAGILAADPVQDAAGEPPPDGNPSQEQA